MSAERRSAFTPNVVIGSGIILLGVALILERLGALDARTLLQYWPVLLILFGASLVIQALTGSDRRPSPVSGGWVIVVIVALFAWQAQRRGEPARAETNAETVSLVAVMGSDYRSSVAPQFRRADMTTLMGQTRLDLRQATLAPGAEAVVDVFALMGGAVVDVPRDWIVQIEAVPLLGRVRDARAQPELEEADLTGLSRNERRRIRRERERSGLIGGNVTLEPLEPRPEDGPPPRVILRGFVMMGGLTIRS